MRAPQISRDFKSFSAIDKNLATKVAATWGKPKESPEPQIRWIPTGSVPWDKTFQTTKQNAYQVVMIKTVKVVLTVKLNKSIGLVGQHEIEIKQNWLAQNEY